jgi:hypothetical protein
MRAVWDQPNEDNVVRSAKRYDPGGDVRRVSIDKKDHRAFIGKFLTKIIDSHKKHHLNPVNKRCFSYKRFR